MTNNPFNPNKSTGFEARDTSHDNDDVDQDLRAHHHTIGTGPNQAASGADLKALTARVASIEARLTAAGIP